jgi:hypothetical protein
MRVLLYGLQSSGASVLAYTFAQKRDSLAFVDIWNTYAAPERPPADRDIVAKVVATTAFSLEAHRRRFRPDATVLVLRHPCDTYESLFGKSYANDNGLIDEKFSLLESVFRAGAEFDDILHYEDFAFCPAEVVAQCQRLGWGIGNDALLFGRSPREIEEANVAGWPGIGESLRYGVGNLTQQGVARDRARFSEPWGKTAHLPRLCPSLFEHYAKLRAQRGETWHVPFRGVLSCGLQALLRELTHSGPIPRRSERNGYRLDFAGGTTQCRISDFEIALHPVARKAATRLTLSGLPGSPFNRIRGAAHLEHPLAPGATVRLRLEGADGKRLAEQEFTLRHGAMRNIDVAFESNQRVSLSVGVRLAGETVSEANSGVNSGVVIRELRLEQAAF